MEIPEMNNSLERLEVLVGQWNLEAIWPEGGPEEVAGTCTFEWELGGRYLVQRTELTIPEAPDTVAVIGPDSRDDARATFVQHYFDSRGVTRIYAMELGDTGLTLERKTPDFSPLDFWQRYVGHLSEGSSQIRGAWEASTDEGRTWDHDFELNFTRMT